MSTINGDKENEALKWREVRVLSENKEEWKPDTPIRVKK